MCKPRRYIISIIPTTCVLGGKMKRFWSSTGIKHVFFDNILARSPSREENSFVINKVTWYRNETNVDMQRILLVELQATVN